jgi:hypothetical protein
MRMIEYSVRPPSEHARIAHLVDAKAVYRNTIDHFSARRIFVAPRDIVARARREHVDVRVL